MLVVFWGSGGLRPPAVPAGFTLLPHPTPSLPLHPPCRRHLNIRGKSANLPAITDRDWSDIRFGVEASVHVYSLNAWLSILCNHRPATGATPASG